MNHKSPSSNSRMDEPTGAVVIAPQVIATVVRQVVQATPGVARLDAGLSQGMSRVWRGKRFGGVHVTVEDGAVSIDSYIVAMSHTPLAPLGQTLQHEIHRAISDVVGMPVRAVNIHFVDVQDPLDAPGASVLPD